MTQISLLADRPRHCCFAPVTASQGALQTLPFSFHQPDPVPCLFLKESIETLHESLSAPCHIFLPKKIKPFANGYPLGSFRRWFCITPGHATPWIIQKASVRSLEQAGSRGIEMNIIDQNLQIIRSKPLATRLLVLNQNSLVTSAEKMPPEAMSGIDPTGEGVLKPLHPLLLTPLNGPENHASVIGTNRRDAHGERLISEW